MAGRIRTIKPELLDDEIAAGLSDAAWRLFVSSWLLADDHGRFRAGSRYLAAQVWQDTTKAQVAGRALAELASAGRIRVYEVDGQTYAEIPTWSRHQRIDNAGKPRIPAPPPPSAHAVADEGAAPNDSDGLDAVSPRVSASLGESPRRSESRGDSPLEPPEPAARPRPPTPTDTPTSTPTTPPSVARASAREGGGGEPAVTGHPADPAHEPRRRRVAEPIIGIGNQQGWAIWEAMIRNETLRILEDEDRSVGPGSLARQAGAMAGELATSGVAARVDLALGAVDFLAKKLADERTAQGDAFCLPMKGFASRLFGVFRDWVKHRGDPYANAPKRTRPGGSAASGTTHTLRPAGGQTRI